MLYVIKVEYQIGYELSLTIDYNKLTTMQRITTGLRTTIGSNIRNGIRSFNATPRINHEHDPRNMDYKQLMNNIMDKTQNICTIIQDNDICSTTYEKKSLNEMLHETMKLDKRFSELSDCFSSDIYTGYISQYYEYDENTDIWTKHKQLKLDYMYSGNAMIDINEYVSRCEEYKGIHDYAIPHISCYLLKDVCEYHPDVFLKNTRDKTTSLIAKQTDINSMFNSSAENINVSLVNYLPFHTVLYSGKDVFNDFIRILNVITENYNVPNGKIVVTQPHYGRMLINTMINFHDMDVQMKESTTKIFHGTLMIKTSYIVKLNDTTFEFII
jgi:hypothetical protein